jgi:probable HAF family extracellular repeat protein
MAGVNVSNRCYILTALLFCAVTAAGGYNVNALKFTSLSFPGARTTEASGINIHGQVVGSWQDSVTGLGHGFVLSDGVYRSFDVPGARGTYPQDINDDGRIVGAYDLPSQEGRVCCETHGFLLMPDGRLLTVTFPGVPGLPVTWLAGINNAGQIVGGYSEFDETIADTRGVHGFLFDDDEFTQIDFPVPMPRVHKPVTFATDINDKGDIVGGYNDDDEFETRRGYVLRDGAFNKFDVPRSATTDLFGVNNAGEIVGEYQDSTGLFSFVFSRKRGFQTLALAGNNKRQISFLLAREINDSGQIVGSYSDSQAGRGSDLSSRRSGTLRWLVGHAPSRRDGRAVQEQLANELLEGTLHAFIANSPSSH